MKAIHFFTAVVALTLSSHWASAATYYVATTHNHMNGDASSDISTALTSAFADVSGSALVIVPAGQYLVESSLTMPGTVSANVTIAGEGIGVTEILCDTTGDLFNLTFPSASYHVTFESLSLLSYDASGCGSAVKITYSSGTPATGLTMQYVNIAPFATTQGSTFAKGIELSNAPNSTVSNAILCNTQGGSSGTGVEVDTESDSLTIQDSQINNWNHGLQLDANESTVTLNRNYWIESVNSVYSGTTVSYLTMNAAHVDVTAASGAAGVNISNASDCTFENILFLCAGAGPSIELKTANSCAIIQNEFFDNTGPTSGVVYLPISIGTSGTSEHDAIEDNTIQFSDRSTGTDSQFPYHLGSYVSYSYIWNNLVMGPNPAEPSPAGGTNGYNSNYNQAGAAFSTY